MALETKSVVFFFLKSVQESLMLNFTHTLPPTHTLAADNPEIFNIPDERKDVPKSQQIKKMRQHI